QVFDWVYQKGVEDFKLMSNLPQSLREYLAKEFCLSRLKTLKKELSSDGTEKFLFGLSDENSIETVFIPDKNRNTLCLSTQVGCKFKCAFCESGQSGFKRNLEPSEIINQYWEVSKSAGPKVITNIVFMGIGEPLDNFEAVVKAIKILVEPKGIALSPRRISLSTCGLVPEIRELAGLKLGIKLSISLHSPDNVARSKLMPINKKYPLEDLIQAVKFCSKNEKYPITFEYALIGGYNTKKDDAVRLIKLLKGVSCKVNLIQLNSSAGQFKPATAQEIEAFIDELRESGLFFTLRKSRGQDIQAACGQLKASLR
ncbi:MAG: 23S rRNA (adenine(2503)-C(2))-methyltransferase RlmN, partial [Candidatus Omnitrophota bacterium]